MPRKAPKHLGSRTSSHPKSSDVILHPRQPQGQLAICANVAINEVLQDGGHVAAFKAEAAQYFLGDGV